MGLMKNKQSKTKQTLFYRSGKKNFSKKCLKIQQRWYNSFNI